MKKFQFVEQVESFYEDPACSFHHIPSIVQMYSDAADVNTRQANKIAGTVHTEYRLRDIYKEAIEKQSGVWGGIEENFFCTFCCTTEMLLPQAIIQIPIGSFVRVFHDIIVKAHDFQKIDGIT